MAESSENITKSCENPKENGVKPSENCKTNPPVNGKTSAGVVLNGNSIEISKPIISQKPSLTQSHKSVHTSLESSSCTKEASNINHVVPRVENKSRTDSKNSSETPSKDRKHNGNGKSGLDENYWKIVKIYWRLRPFV